VVAAYPADRVFELDRTDVNDCFVVGDYITAVAMQTGALVSERTTITAKNVGGYSIPNVQLDGVLNNYPTGSLVALLPSPGFCMERVGVPSGSADEFKANILLDPNAAAYASTITLGKFIPYGSTMLDQSVFGPLPGGKSLKYLIRHYGIAGEHIMMMPNHIWGMPMTADLSWLAPGDRIRTGAGLDPSNFFLTPFGSLYDMAFSGVPVIGPDAVR